MLRANDHGFIAKAARILYVRNCMKHSGLHLLDRCGERAGGCLQAWQQIDFKAAKNTKWTEDQECPDVIYLKLAIYRERIHPMETRTRKDWHQTQREGNDSGEGGADNEGEELQVQQRGNR